MMLPPTFLKRPGIYLTGFTVALVAVVGVVGWRFNWLPRAFAPTVAPGSMVGSALPIATGTPPAATSPRPTPSPSPAIPYTGAPVSDLHADPVFLAQVPPARYAAAKEELASLASKLAADPLQPSLWMRVAYLKHYYNDDLGTRDAYEYLNRIAPQDAVAFYNLAVLYGYNLKEPVKARPKFGAAIRLNPFNAGFYVGFANFYLEVAGDAAAAERVLLRGFEMLPTDAGITSNLGAYYRDHGNIPKAIEFYEKTLAAKELSADERAAIQAEVDALKSTRAGE